MGYEGNPNRVEVAEIEIANNVDVLNAVTLKYNINMVAVAMAVITIESDFNGKLIQNEHSVGDKSIGYMQLRRDTARWVGKYKYLTDSEIEKRLLIPRINIRLGIRYLCWQIYRYHGNMEKAIPSYNAGSYREINGKCVNKVYYKKWKKSYEHYKKEALIYD